MILYPPPQTSRPLSSHQLSFIRSLSSNNFCIECNAPSGTNWASVTYGVVLYRDCASIHRGLDVHLSFVKNMNMDYWTDDQYRHMVGGGECQVERVL